MLLLKKKNQAIKAKCAGNQSKKGYYGTQGAEESKYKRDRDESEYLSSKNLKKEKYF